MWAEKLEKLLKKMFQAKEKAIAADKQQLSYSQLHRFDKEYDSIIAIALNENPLSEASQGKRGRKKKGKVLALIERLRDYKESVCLFIHDFKVPFTNNQALCELFIYANFLDAPIPSYIFGRKSSHK